MNAQEIETLTQQIMDGYSISQAEATALSQTTHTDVLYQCADQLRLHFSGQHIDMCSIMNAQSGRCSEDCKWCSQSRSFKTGVQEYELVSPEEGVAMALRHSQQGVNRFSLVTSGRALKPRQVKKACDIYKAIHQATPVKLCASMGLLKKPELEALKEAGVGRYHCNIETAASHFPTLCTTHTFEEKVRTIRDAQSIGMKICSGGILGMGETMAQRIEMAFSLRELAVDSIPVNILNPIEGTPLEGNPPLTDAEILTSIALFRFVNPTAHIRLAGGRGLIAHMQERVLKAGVSAVLVGDYLTTLGAGIAEDKALFKQLGRLPEASDAG